MWLVIADIPWQANVLAEIKKFKTFNVLVEKSNLCYADWGPLHLSLVVCHIFHLPIPLLWKNLILQGLQQKWQKFCSRCNKNTWHDESSYISQPPKYLLLFVNRFRYINNNVTKDRCSIPLDTTVRLGPLKFSLRANIDHHGPSTHPGHYTASINCCKIKTFDCNDHTFTEFGIIDSKTLLLHILYYMNWLTRDFWTEQGVGVWSPPWRWHILAIPLTTGRATGAETCGLDDVFPPDGICSHPEALC